MKLINCAERIPELPNPLPPNTEDERGIVFINRTHSCSFIYYPSYGYDAVKYLTITEDGHWSLEQWEWLDEEYSLEKEILKELGATNANKLYYVVDKDKWVLGFIKGSDLEFDTFIDVVDFLNTEDQ
jgi:hypothetical protein